MPEYSRKAKYRVSPTPAESEIELLLRDIVSRLKRLENKVDSFIRQPEEPIQGRDAGAREKVKRLEIRQRI